MSNRHLDVVSIGFKVRRHSRGLIAMDRLPTRVDRSGQDWQRRKEQNLALAADLKERLEVVKQGGGGKYVERHRSRGKMLPRERIAEICDPEAHSWNCLVWRRMNRKMVKHNQPESLPESV